MAINDGTECTTLSVPAVCTVLIFGVLLLLMDTVFDVQYLFTRDPTNIYKYYDTILRPSRSPPWPGFFGVAFGVMPLLTYHLRWETSAGMYVSLF
jgi:hypothetical protein